MRGGRGGRGRARERERGAAVAVVAARADSTERLDCIYCPFLRRRGEVSSAGLFQAISAW